MATDDFSFPTHKPPCTIDSPPLWHLSPEAGEEIVSTTETGCDQTRRKSFSHIERGGGGRSMADEDECREEYHHEKMDMLWEDFNEEVIRSRATILSDYSGRLSREMMQLGCVNRALRWSKTSTNGGGDHVLSTTRKPSLVPIMKVFRRLFFLHNSHHKLKRPAW